MDTFEPSESVGLAWFHLTFSGLIGEVLEPKDAFRVALLDPRCGVTYDDRISYARTAEDNSGVRPPALCPLLKLVRLDEAGDGEGEDAVGWNK